MKLPEPLIRLINPTMALLLRSPLHWLMSASVLVLSFEGRRTGRSISLPLRYLEDESGVTCFTTDDARWWRNFESPRSVGVRVAGTLHRGMAVAGHLSEGVQIDRLRSFLTQFPGDATYQGIAIVDGRPLEADLARAVARTIHLRISTSNDAAMQ